MNPIPSYDQVLALPAVTELTVPPEYLDENDHMNIGFYLELAARGLGTVCSEVGMDATYIDQRRLTVFTAEHHLRYLGELRLGDALSVHVQLLERSGKTLHALAYMLDRARDTVAFTFEAVLVHVGMDTRRPADFPDDVASHIDALITAHTVAWPAPVCGVMGVRRR